MTRESRVTPTPIEATRGSDGVRSSSTEVRGRRARFAVIVVAFVPACAPTGGPGPGAVFRDVTRELGLPVVEAPPPDGVYFLPEAMKGGVGLFDYDRDGDLDLLHVRAPLPGGVKAKVSNRLYRQEADGRFVDVTAAAGLDRPGFGQGLAIGDIDNDGDLDVYVTNLGPDELYRNDGDGSFTRVTTSAGFSGSRWSSAAAFFDYDADGFLDLYVVHYLRGDPARRCTDPRDRVEYCGPLSFSGWPDRLYRNEGDGSFRDVTAEAGIVLPEQGERATGLGTLCTDFTGDGLADVFVANDAQSNQLWVNQGDGTFLEEGILRGVAANEFGHAEASMGVTAGDVNADGVLDIFVTHLWQESNRLYVGNPSNLFDDRTAKAQLSRFDRDRTGWGCGFFDFDHDGDLDLAAVNGGIKRRPPLPGAPAGMWSEYAEPNQLFENDGNGRFDQNDAKAGPFGELVEVSRGLAFGDLDRDGDLDLVVSGIDDALRVYRNDAPALGSHWLQVRALTRGRDALGSQVWVAGGGREWSGALLASSSYLSSSEPVVHFGLGALDLVDEVRVRWPDGRIERFPGGAVDRVMTLEEGRGETP